MNPKIKILYVITKSNWGGAQRYVFDLATSLDKNIFDIGVVLGGNGLLKQKLTSENISTISLPSLERDINLKKELLSAKRLWQILKKEKPDIVHLNSSKAGAIGAIVARAAGVKKIIFTAHAWAFNENRSFLSQIIITFFHWLTVILSHKTIAVSESVKNQIIHLPFIKNKIEVIYPGIQQFEFKTRENSRNLLTSKNETLENIWVGTIAELHPIKGLVYYIDAINLIKDKYPDVKFCVLGEGEERKNLEGIITENELTEKVQLLGFMEDAKTYLKAFDIFVLPSLSEAFGYVVGEAGIAALPVIASNVGGIPEIIENNISGILVPSKNPLALATAIESYIQNPLLRELHGKKLNESVIKNFNLETTIQKTELLYTAK